MYQKSQFKSPVGVYYLRGLFFETTGMDKTSVLYSLKDQDHNSFPSLYRLYMEANDPSEYSFATAHLFGWEHWEKLCECTWFKEYISVWRRELDTRIRGEALRNIRELADIDKPTSFQANKYLLDGGWKATSEGKQGRGRPTKADIQKAAGDLARASQDTNNDYIRIMGSA